MTYEITQNLIPGLPKNPYRHGVSAYEGVVNHSTENTAPAINERNYEASGAWKNAFVHFFVDWTSIIQVADINYIAWGAGPNANPRYVHIELCQTSDPKQFAESYSRYVWLTAKVLKDKNLGVTDGCTLVSHAWVTKNLGGTTHTDPIDYLASHGISWDQHVTNVQAQYNAFFAPAPAASAPTQDTEWTPTSNPICAQVRVIASALNIRKGPGNQYSVIEVAPKGKIFNVTANINDWHEVIVDDHTKGYAFGNKGTYLELIR